MKKILTFVLSVVLCAALTAGSVLPAAAADDANGGVSMDRSSLELLVGEKDVLKAKFKSDYPVKWSSSDENTVKVGEDGTVEGVAVGEAVITAECGGKSTSCHVYVVEKEFDFDENILISIFWPPTSAYITDEQYKYMADAEIDWVLGAGDGIGSKAKQLKMLELCYKYGIGMCVGDDRFGGNLLGMKEKRIASLVEEYRNVPGANGFYMLDEPYNPNVFIDAYKALKDCDPHSYMHLNFLPGHAYPSYDVYERQMNDWLRLCESVGYPQDYLMYDMYPFPLQKNTISRDPMMSNLNSVRKVGLANGVKTAMYIQSVSQTAAFRSLNREETLFEFNIGLAFGIKQFSYFTWFTPHNRNEPFDQGIITYDGKPNEKYTFICEIDKMIHNVGATMINLDAYEVYGTLRRYGSVGVIPDGFFVRSENKSDLTVSYMKDKKTGRNYCMVVNNLFDKKQRIKLQFDDDIGALQYVSYDDGKLYDLDTENGLLQADLEKGEALIIALPEGYDYSAKNVKTYAPTDDLALDAQITCTSSAGENGWYMCNLNDGQRFADTGMNGWRSASSDGLDTITVDLGGALEFDRIDLYPATSDGVYGNYMPTDFTVSYSEDGENWYTIAKAADLSIRDLSAPSLRFGKVFGRYVKIEITGCRSNRSELGEIEIYDDDGTVPPVELPKTGISVDADDNGKPVNYTPGSNLAKNKKVTVSTYPESPDYKTWGWYPDFLVDGKQDRGWTSNVKIHMGGEDATEYAIVDLGDEFEIEKIEIFEHGCWPKDFTVSVSSDGKDFRDLAEEKDSPDGIGSYVVEPEDAHGRFVMFCATRLRNTDADGYMLQLGELEVYGKPYLDRETAEADIKLFLDGGGDENSASLKAVRDALENERTTKKELDALLTAMLDEANVTVPVQTEALTEAATAAEYDFDYGPYERPAKETETEAEPEPTEPEQTGSEPDPETTAPEEKTDGMSKTLKTGLIVGGALAAAALIAAAAITIIKKKKK